MSTYSRGRWKENLVADPVPPGKPRALGDIILYKADKQIELKVVDMSGAPYKQCQWKVSLFFGGRTDNNYRRQHFD